LSAAFDTILLLTKVPEREYTGKWITGPAFTNLRHSKRYHFKRNQNNPLFSPQSTLKGNQRLIGKIIADSSIFLITFMQPVVL
jgi:hypothetical protein